MEIQTQQFPQLTLREGSWSWKGLLIRKRRYQLYPSLQMITKTTAAVMYIEAIKKQETRADLKDTNLKILVALTTMHIEMMSEMMKFLPLTHHPTINGIAKATPSISTTLTLKYLRLNQNLMQSFLMILQKNSIHMTDTPIIPKIQLMISRMMPACVGKKRLSSPKSSMQNATMKMNLKLQVMPFPSKESNLAMKTAIMSVVVARKMRSSLPHSKQMALKEMLQLRSQEKVAMEGMDILMASKQLDVERDEGQLYWSETEQLELHCEVLSVGANLLYLVETVKLSGELVMMLMMEGVFWEYWVLVRVCVQMMSEHRQISLRYRKIQLAWLLAQREVDED